MTTTQTPSATHDLLTSLVARCGWQPSARRLRVRRDDLSIGMLRSAIREALAGEPVAHYDGRCGQLPAGVGWSAAIGGTVNNSYGYPAETECSAVYVERTGPSMLRIDCGVTRISANKATLSGAMVAAVRGPRIQIAFRRLDDGAVELRGLEGHTSILWGAVSAIDTADLVRRHPDVEVSIQDSIAAGNCAAGTRSYAQALAARTGLPITDHAPIAVVWADRQDAFSARAILRSLRAAGVTTTQTRVPARIASYYAQHSTSRARTATPTLSGVGLL